MLQLVAILITLTKLLSLAVDNARQSLMIDETVALLILSIVPEGRVLALVTYCWTLGRETSEDVGGSPNQIPCLK